MSSEDQTRVWDMMNDLDYCMLVTQTTTGLRSRPMSSIVKHEEGKIYFLSDTSGAKDDEIAKNPQILLAYSNGSNKFVSATATGHHQHRPRTDQAALEPRCPSVLARRSRGIEHRRHRRPANRR